MPLSTSTTLGTPMPMLSASSPPTALINRTIWFRMAGGPSPSAMASVCICSTRPSAIRATRTFVAPRSIPISWRPCNAVLRDFWEEGTLADISGSLFFVRKIDGFVGHQWPGPEADAQNVSKGDIEKKHANPQPEGIAERTDHQRNDRSAANAGN